MRITRDTQQTVEEVLNDLKAGGDNQFINDLAAKAQELVGLLLVISILFALLGLLIYWLSKKKRN